MTIPSVLKRQAARSDSFALSWYCDGVFGNRYTYRDLCENVATAVGALIRLEVRVGDRVVVLSDNSPQMFFLLLAIMSLGSVAVPINPTESRRILRYVISTTKPILVVTVGESGRRFEKAADGCSSVTIEELFRSSPGSGFDFSTAGVGPDWTAAILFTSGTTSEPKGVCLSHFNLLTNARGLCKVHNLFKNNVHMCVLPLFHANAFGYSLVASIFAGSHVVLCNGMPGYVVWSIIERERVSIISVVPQILRVLSARPRTRPGSDCLKYFVSAAAPLSRELASDFIKATGVRIHQGYGLTECVNFATTIPGDITDSAYEHAMFSEMAPSIGTPLEGCDVSIRCLNRTGHAPPGEQGEIVVSGDTLMSGYWENREASRAAIVDGELRTGDLGFYTILNDRRFFFVTGRIKEIIIRHGEKISPLAVEADLQGLHVFGKFAVAGFHNTAAGEEIGLYVQVEGTSDRARIADAVKRCSRSYRPRLVMIGAKEIPVTHTGKVKRDVLGKRFSSFSDHVFGKEPVIVEETSPDRCINSVVARGLREQT